MIDVSLAIFGIFIALFFIGIGPTLLLARSQRLEAILAVAPSIGLVITTLLGTYLTILLNYPIRSWATPFLLIAIVFSIFLSFFAIYLQKGKDIFDKRLFQLLSLGILLISMMVMLPMLVGGLDFSVLRGNRIDTFNYIALAGYLLNEPVAWLQQASVQAILDKHPNYYIVSGLASDRTVFTAMLMGWTAAITHLPLYRLEYGFTTLFYILLFGPSFVLALQCKIKPMHAMIVATALCVGFWAQIVMDIRAMSHISVLPCLLLFVYILTTPKTPHNPLTRPILLGLIFAAIALLYIEILPTLLLGCIIYAIVSYVHNKIVKKDVQQFLLTLLVICVALIPIFSQLSQTLLGRISSLFYGGHGNNNWDMFYFPWLYNKPFIGFWGLSLFNVDSSWFIHIVLFLLSVIFSILLTYSLTLLFKKKYSSSFYIVHAITLVALLEFFYLGLTGRYWAAGKALTYGYPFMLFVLALWLTVEQNKVFKFAKYLTLSWFLLQCTLGIYRISNAAVAKDYTNYIIWAEYRQHDLNFDEISKAIIAKGCHVLGVSIENRMIAEYVGLVYGWDMPVINSAGIHGWGDKLLGYQSLQSKPNCLIKDRKTLSKQDVMIAGNRDYVLIKINT